MEIKAKRGDLLATLYWTQSIVERRNTMPILANVLLESQKKDIRVTATDLEVGVRGSLEGDFCTWSVRMFHFLSIRRRTRCAADPYWVMPILRPLSS